MLYIRLRDDAVFKFDVSDVVEINVSGSQDGLLLVTVSHTQQGITVFSEYNFPSCNIVEYRIINSDVDLFDQ